MSRAKQPVSINGLEFDALISQDESFESTVPEYSVEEGYTITDSIILSPEKLNMTLYATNTPVTWHSQHGGSMDRVENVIQQLKEIYFSRTPVTIVTTDVTFTNMAITSLSISKSVEIGTSREIPISFKKINITKTETTTIPASYGKSGATKKSTGTANTSTTSTTAKTSTSSNSKNSNSSGSKSSILYSAASSLGLLK